MLATAHADASASGASTAAETSWDVLPLEVVDHVASHLGPNEVACTLRLVSKRLAGHLTARDHTTVRLSQPVPAHAFAWRWRAPGATRNLTLKRRRAFLALTAASGDLNNLELAAEVAGCSLVHVGSSEDGGDLMASAAVAGHLHVCQWLWERGCPWGAAAVAAGKFGHQHLCEWLLGNGCVCWRESGLAGVADAATEAARGGHCGLVDWLLRRRAVGGIPTLAGDLLEGAAEGFDLAALQRLYDRWVETGDGDDDAGDGRGDGRELDMSEKEAMLAAAAGSPTPDWQAKVVWLEGLGYPRTAAACTRAVGCTDAQHRLTWLQQRGHVIDHRVIAAAAKTGNVAVLQHIFAGAFLDHIYLPPFEASDEFWSCHGPPWWAACGGHLAALQCLQAHGLPIAAPTVHLPALERGHLGVVAWLVETFGVVLEDVESEHLHAAFRSGNVELLRWLHERGFTWGPTALAAAVDGGCEAAIEWLVENGCPMPAPPYSLPPIQGRGDPYCQAAGRGDLAILRCLHRLGVPMNACCCPINSVLGRRDLATLRCLTQELGCVWTPTADQLKQCIAGDPSLAKLRWLVEESRCPVLWVEALRAAQGLSAKCREPVVRLLEAERERRRPLGPLTPAVFSCRCFLVRRMRSSST